MGRSPQREILAYLVKGGRLTVARAARLFHTTELRRIVSRLRKRGFTICADRARGMTEDGRPTQYNVYYMLPVRERLPEKQTRK